ncbi:MAG: hypothetical protein KME54_07170 [Tolypothrix brevis GSE-NOS-MK-07-07A]|nr:hypothetical protein [Tolypothrix brevis GSE-NOS-MK-07-07A]
MPYVAAYGNECPMFWIGNRGELTEIPPSSGFHLAFVASDRSTVDAFYAPAMGIGAKDDGKPGLRPQEIPASNPSRINLNYHSSCESSS